jgi:hypothetical protein
MLKSLSALTKKGKGIRTANVPGPMPAQQVRAAQRGVDSWTSSAKKAPNILSRIFRTQGGTGPIGKKRLALPLVVGGLLASKLDQSEPTPTATFSDAEIAKALGGSAESRALIEDYYTNMSKLAETSGANLENYRTTAEGDLQNYLNSIQGYAGAQGGAINRAYEQLAEQSRTEAQRAAQESQMAASDIDRLYGTAADQAAQFGAGQGLTTGTSDVSGLTGVSGAMAEAPDVGRTYGQSLADWMGRQGIISRQDMESAAQSYLAQGVGTRAQLEAEAAGLGSRARYDLGQRLREMEFQQQQQRAAQLFDLGAQRQESLLSTDVEDERLQQQARIASLQAEKLWDTIKNDGPTKRMWESLGVTNPQTLAEKLRDPQFAGLVQLLAIGG